MKMNFRERLFTFSGLVLCLFQFSLSQELAPPVRTLNVVPLCENYNSTVNLGHSNAILKAAGEHGPLDCEVLLGKSLGKSIVISFYEYDLDEDDELVFKDSEGTELSLTGIGQHLSGKKSFIFKSPVAIHFATNGSSSYKVKDKFKFVFTLTHDSLCKKDEFKCTNLQCISKYLVCNQLNNCGDGSDEIDCNRLCTANEFKCDNKKCIPKYKVCNLRDDCGDMSDEKICNQDCEIHQQFKCSNSRCISNLQVCDDENDCGDWSDETNCYHACDYNKFRCNNKKCIDSWKVCNNRDDCGDRSDEKNCRSCYSYEFRCSNRKCISNSLVCNNRDDCGDFSDEKGCSSTHKLREDEIVEREVRPLMLPIILSSVAIGIVLIVLITLSICFCVTKAKSSKQPKNTAASAAQQPAPNSLMGRMRQSFRSHGQPSAPPLEMVTGSENVPHEFQRPQSVMGRIRQSFRSRQQQTVQPPDTNTASDMRSENPGRPAIYPNLPAGVDNPEFKVEE